MFIASIIADMIAWSAVGFTVSFFWAIASGDDIGGFEVGMCILIGLSIGLVIGVSS